MQAIAPKQPNKLDHFLITIPTNHSIQIFFNLGEGTQIVFQR